MGQRAQLQGLVVSPRLGQEMTMEEQAAVRAKIDEALAAAGDQMSEVEGERESVRSPIMRDQIADVGPYFSEGKLLTQMVLDANAIVRSVDRLHEALSGWFESFEESMVDAIHARAREISNGISAAGQEPIVDEDERLAQLHTARHTDPIDALAAEAYAMANVEAPAGGGASPAGEPPSVDVKSIAIGAGILAAGGILAVVLSA
jgi:hypothetical protein